MSRQGFDIPASVRAATEKFRAEADPMRSFVEDTIKSMHPNATRFVPRTDVLLAYQEWCYRNGHHPMSGRRFYEQFRQVCNSALEHPLREPTIHGEAGYKGLEIMR